MEGTKMEMKEGYQKRSEGGRRRSKRRKESRRTKNTRIK
jgi:hypothetical protein